MRIRQNEAIVQSCLIASAVLLGEPAVPSRAEAPPTNTSKFRARDLVDTKLLRGPDYVIEDEVSLVDDHYLFTLRTSAGPITAHGLGMLQVRVDEMHALQKARALDEESQEMEGVKESIKQTGRGIEGLLTDPKETLSNIPKGLGRKVKSIAKGDKGGGNTRRQFAAAVGADPETDNPPLKKILDKLALRRKIGKGAVAVGGMALTAGAANLAIVTQGASAVRTTADMNQAVRNVPLYKINEQIRDELRGLDVDPEACEAFIEHDAMTTVQRLLFMEQFRRLSTIKGSPRLVRMALEMTDRPESIGLIRSMERIARIHQKSPLAEILESDWLVVKLADASIFCVSSADYLTDSEELKQDVPAFRRQHGDAKLAFLTTGKVAPSARKVLEQEKIRVIEDGEIQAIQP